MMFMIKQMGVGVGMVLSLFLYTKQVWQSGFDQGADVDSCVIVSIINDGKLAKDEPPCIRAKKYETNPYWLLRRNGPIFGE